LQPAQRGRASGLDDALDRGEIPMKVPFEHRFMVGDPVPQGADMLQIRVQSGAEAWDLSRSDIGEYPSQARMP